MYNLAQEKLSDNYFQPQRIGNKKPLQGGGFSLKPQPENYHWWTSDVHKVTGLDMTPTIEHVKYHLFKKEKKINEKEKPVQSQGENTNS